MTWVRRLLILVPVRSFALKWFWPGLRAISLPFFVIFMRFRYDLLVFVVDMLLSLKLKVRKAQVIKLLFFEVDRQSLWPLHGLLSDLILYCDELEDAFEALFQEVKIHILGSSD